MYCNLPQKKKKIRFQLHAFTFCIYEVVFPERNYFFSTRCIVPNCKLTADGKGEIIEITLKFMAIPVFISIGLECVNYIFLFIS